MFRLLHHIRVGVFEALDKAASDVSTNIRGGGLFMSRLFNDLGRVSFLPLGHLCALQLLDLGRNGYVYSALAIRGERVVRGGERGDAGICTGYLGHLDVSLVAFADGGCNLRV